MSSNELLAAIEAAKPDLGFRIGEIVFGFEVLGFLGASFPGLFAFVSRAVYLESGAGNLRFVPQPTN